MSDLCTPWCVHVASTLRIADHIKAGSKEIAALAKAAGANQDSLHRLLRHLVGKGVFLEPTYGVFDLNDTAQGVSARRRASWCAEAAHPAGRVLVFTNAGPGQEASPAC